MSQKSSLPQSSIAVSEALTPNIHEYLEKWRPLIGQDGNSYLFPVPGLGSNEGANEKALRKLAGRLSRLVRSRLGVKFNIHILRSLLASIYAEVNPGDERTVQTKLGHKREATTHRYYIDTRQVQAHRRFDAIIERQIAADIAIQRKPGEEAPFVPH